MITSEANFAHTENKQSHGITHSELLWSIKMTGTLSSSAGTTSSLSQPRNISSEQSGMDAKPIPCCHHWESVLEVSLVKFTEKHPNQLRVKTLKSPTNTE